MATLAPSAARRLAIAAPMPREPPVTSATLPASGLSCVAFIGWFLSALPRPLRPSARLAHPNNTYVHIDSQGVGFCDVRADPQAYAHISFKLLNETDLGAVGHWGLS